MIGIDRDSWLVYEGVSNYGHGVWPTPIVTRATFIASPDDWAKLPTSLHIDDAKFVFREDMFDSVSRLRRGRLYEWQSGQGQPSEWHVNQHPALFEDVGQRDHQGRFRKSLLSYHDAHGFGSRLQSSNTEIVIALGSMDALTLWTVVAVEKSASGQDLLTLRARSNYGVLPELDLQKVPPNSSAVVLSAIERLRTSAYREQATSIVEQCRHTAQIILSHWFSAVTNDPDRSADLSALTKKIEACAATAKKTILLNTARTLALLHNRVKPNVQEKLGDEGREIQESDGEFALQAVALLLKEVGWHKQ